MACVIAPLTRLTHDIVPPLICCALHSSFPCSPFHLCPLLLIPLFPFHLCLSLFIPLSPFLLYTRCSGHLRSLIGLLSATGKRWKFSESDRLHLSLTSVGLCICFCFHTGASAVIACGSNFYHLFSSLHCFIVEHPNKYLICRSVSPHSIRACAMLLSTSAPARKVRSCPRVTMEDDRQPRGRANRWAEVKHKSRPRVSRIRGPKIAATVDGWHVTMWTRLKFIHESVRFATTSVQGGVHRYNRAYRHGTI